MLETWLILLVKLQTRGRLKSVQSKTDNKIIFPSFSKLSKIFHAKQVSEIARYTAVQ